MKPRFAVLGKSHFALSVIFDILHLRYPEGCSVEVVRNIPDTVNTSAGYDYSCGNVESIEVDQKYWDHRSDVPLIMGSIGRSRSAIYKSFEESHGVHARDFIAVIHPESVIPTTAAIGAGAHIGPGVTIAPFAHIGAFCVVNRSSTVGHHSRLDDFACINPGVVVSGVCHVGKHVTIGAGATIIDGITVGENSIVGAGSVVTRDVAPNVVCYGVPARKIRDLDAS